MFKGGPLKGVASGQRIFTAEFACLFVAVFLMFFALDHLIPVLPFYVLAVGGGETAVGMLMGIYTFSSIILRPMQGRNMDLRGRKRLLLGGALLFAFPALALLFLPPLPIMFLLRSLQGFGWGAFLLAYNTLTLDLAPPGRSGEAVGLMGVAPPLSLAVAPLAGEALMGTGGEPFRLPFLVSGLAALLVFILGSRVREPLRSRSLQRPALFSRPVYFPAAMVFFITFNLGTILTFMPLLGEERGFGGVGLFYTFFALSAGAFRFFGGRLSDRVGRREVFRPALVLAAGSLALIALSGSEGLLYLSGLLLGAGFGASHSSILALAADRLAPADRGSGMATFTTAFDLGIFVGAVVPGFLIAYFGFSFLFFFCALVMLLPILLDYFRQNETFARYRPS